jgi:hypothetical protein
MLRDILHVICGMLNRFRVNVMLMVVVYPIPRK